MKTIRKALADLVTLKIHRDRHGKDATYIAAKPQAWESAIKALNADPSAEEQLTGSETLFGFIGWLSTQKYVPPIGKHHDCAIWADLVDRFCKSNELNEPREGWEALMTLTEYP